MTTCYLPKITPNRSIDHDRIDACLKEAQTAAKTAQLIEQCKMAHAHPEQ